MSNIMDLFRLDGKVALVTGAARGIGAACAEALAQAGARVMLTDILAEEGERKAAALRGAGFEVAFLVHDVTRAEDWEAAVTGTVERFRGLDILVNNAGIEIVDPILEMTEESWNTVQSVNSGGVFLGTKHAAAAMIPGGTAGKGGSIINVSSVAGLIGLAGFTGYCASKGAVRLLSKAAAAEFGRLGIRVNSLHPGLIETEMGRNTVVEMADLGFGGDVAQAEEFLQTAKIPLECFGNTTDIAAAVVYLASDAARYITGSELVVDGGAVGTL